MNDSQIQKLITKLDILIKINAKNLTLDKSFKEQVMLLNSIGIPLKEIAEIVNKKPTDIGQYIYRKKKSPTIHKQKKE